MRRKEGVSVRLLGEERAIVLDIARQERLSISQALRHIIRESGRQRGLWPPAQQQQKEAKSQADDSRQGGK